MSHKYIRSSMSNKWSNNFDKRPHRHIVICRNGEWILRPRHLSDTCFLGPTQVSHVQTATRSYTAAKTLNAFQYGGQSPQMPLPLGRSWPYLIHGSLAGRTRLPLNDISISSAVSAGLTNVTNRQSDGQTHRPTDHATPCLAISRYR